MIAMDAIALRPAEGPGAPRRVVPLVNGRLRTPGIVPELAAGLTAALASRRRTRPEDGLASLVVYADARTSAETLYAVLHTATTAGLADLHVAVGADAPDGGFEVALERSEPHGWEHARGFVLALTWGPSSTIALSLEPVDGPEAGPRGGHALSTIPGSCLVADPPVEGTSGALTEIGRLQTEICNQIDERTLAVRHAVRSDTSVGDLLGVMALDRRSASCRAPSILALTDHDPQCSTPTSVPEAIARIDASRPQPTEFGVITVLRDEASALPDNTVFGWDLRPIPQDQPSEPTP